MLIFDWSWKRRKNFGLAIEIFSLLLGIDEKTICERMIADSDMHTINFVEHYDLPDAFKYAINPELVSQGHFYYRVYAIEEKVRTIWLELVFFDSSKEDACSGYFSYGRVTIADRFSQPKWQHFGQAKLVKKGTDFVLDGGQVIAHIGFSQGPKIIDQEGELLDIQDVRQFIIEHHHPKVSA